MWIAGCSTGEEAYSIAITLRECLEELSQRLNVQIFATDIDEEAIETARQGIYPASISTDVEPDRLSRFFTRENNTYRLNIYPQAIKLINLIPSDVGSPVYHVVSNLKYDRLAEDAKQVVANLIPKETEVETKEGQWYFMRIFPYRTLEHVIEEVVITFNDISQIKASEANIRLLGVVLKDSNDAVIVLDLEGNITAWNNGALRIYGYSETEALKMNIRDLIPKEDVEEALFFIKQVTEGKELKPFKTRRQTKEGKIVEIDLTATPLVEDQGKTIAIATTERGIHSKK
ncbi:PAS domain S-box protein [Deltaproteobacteria bacterium TL4]